VDDERFVPFAALLRAGGAAVPVAAGAPGAPPTPAPAETALGRGIDALAAELALLRASALEVFERASARLLLGLAEEVLGRELALAPCDTGALVGRFLAELSAYEPSALVVSAADAGRVRASLPVRVESNLHAGDAIVEVRDGAFESQLAVRLEALVATALREAA
jgi:flagellar biosynthesis/type III secretory pathway protein FliH